MKTDYNIENLLMSGKKLSLSTHERATIKSSLLEHASETLKYEGQSISSPWIVWAMRGAISFASLLVVFVGTAYASQDSLPGESLYAIKVRVIEEMIAFTKVTPQDRVAYDTSLMETRLDELQALILQEETPQPEDLASVVEQINEHVTHIEDTLETTETSVMTHEEKIHTLTKVSGVAKAQAKIAQKEARFTTISEMVSNSQKSVTDARTSAVEGFVEEESTEVVGNYLSDQIIEVGEQVHTIVTNKNTRDSAERHLYDVDEALIDGDTSEALISILEAQEVMSVDAYLNNSDIKSGADRKVIKP